MKNKKTVIAIIVLALIVIGTGVLLIVFNNDKIQTSKKTPEAKETKKEGHKKTLVSIIFILCFHRTNMFHYQMPVFPHISSSPPTLLCLTPLDTPPA